MRADALPKKRGSPSRCSVHLREPADADAGHAGGVLAQSYIEEAIVPGLGKVCTCASWLLPPLVTPVVEKCPAPTSAPGCAEDSGLSSAAVLLACVVHSRPSASSAHAAGLMAAAPWCRATPGHSSTHSLWRVCRSRGQYHVCCTWVCRSRTQQHMFCLAACWSTMSMGYLPMGRSLLCCALCVHD